MLWTDKYRPNNIKELRGNSHAVESAIKWISNISKISFKPLIISGPSGVGKTCLSEILLKINNYHTVILDTANLNSKKKIKIEVRKVHETIPK